MQANSELQIDTNLQKPLLEIRVIRAIHVIRDSDDEHLPLQHIKTKAIFV